MPGHDIVVIGASAGGVEALTEVVRELPADFPSAILVVLHISSDSPSKLPEILAHAGKLPAMHPKNGQAIEPGHIYVAPPDHHMVVHQARIYLVRGPRENRHRPAIDPLFRSAARYYGGRSIGVILSGMLDDGASGLRMLKKCGGIAVVQDPEDAAFPDMPRNALEVADADHVVPVSQLAALLVRLTEKPAHAKKPVAAESLKSETNIAEFNMQEIENGDRQGKPSPYSCPECHGVLWEIDEPKLLRFRCRVGHAFTANNLMAEQEQSLEGALWTALRALEESAALSRRLSEGATERKSHLSAGRYQEQAESKEQQALIVREMLLRTEKLAETGT